jgi:glycosyltransferase involved in cell wall biosynthesis
MSARILIVSNGALCRNPRVVKEASALAHAGYRVTVLTVRNHAASEGTDRMIMQTARFERITVDMLPGFGTGTARVAFRRLRLRLARDAAVRMGWTSIHALGPASSLLDAARRVPADLTIVHNEISHWAGTRLLAAGRCVAADIEDWHSEDLLPQDRRGRPLGRLRRTERTLLHGAAYTTTTSLALATALHQRYGGRMPHVLTNSFPLQADPHPGAPGSPPSFLWFSQTLGPGRGLQSFVAAWILTKQPSRLVLVGEAHAVYRARLLAGLPAEFSARVTVLPLVAPAALPTLIAEHDIGLALELTTIPNRDLTITNKILQYLNAGLAVVATPTQGQREVLSGAPIAGLLARLDDPAQLATELDALLGDRVMLAARQRAARHLAASRYCWEREAPRLLGFVHDALSAARNP